MELKREMFFNGEEILYENIINTVTQHPQEMKRIAHLGAREARRRLSSYINGQITKEKLFAINRNYTPTPTA